MKRIILIFIISLNGLFGFCQEVTFEFDITAIENDGAVTVRISGAPEWGNVICEKIGEGEAPLDNLYFDFETEQLVAEVFNLSEGDYKFTVDFDGEIFEETVSVNLESQSNPLTVSFVTINQKGANLGQITATITTGSTEPTVECLDVNNNPMNSTSSIYNASTNTLEVIYSNLTAGNYNIIINDETSYLDQSTSILYEVISLGVNYSINHVLNDSDAQVSAIIAGGTENSVVTFNKHGDSTPINYTSSFDQATYQKTIIVSNLSEGVYEVHVNESGFDVYSYVWVGKHGTSTTLSVQPDENFGKDAYLAYLTRPGLTHLATTNYGNYTANPNFYGTHGGYPYKGKS